MKKRLLAGFLTLVLAFNQAVSVNSKHDGANASSSTKPAVEYLDRGIAAINTGKGIMVSWRFLANDPDNAVFRLYRNDALIYTSEAGKATSYIDAQGTVTGKYRVDTVSGGTVTSTSTCNLISNNAYLSVPISPPSSAYSANDSSVGDADGDGEYEIFLKWEPNNAKDNSQAGVTDPVYIDCYKLNGTRLWRINLGKNIRAGAHYTQMLVADFDLCGKAEMMCKTADGTTDGKGKIIGDASKDYRNADGYILTGPEFYSLFDGETGAAIDTVNYKPARGTVTDWGDGYGNRVDRFLGAVAYLDGVRPSGVTVRGYYTRMTATAYDVVNKKLVERWAFDTGNTSSAAGYGNGNHNCMPADVDGDGKQEIVLGATAIDHDGKVLWCTKNGHGDALHVGNFDPSKSGFEVFTCHESSPYGVSLRDGKDGREVFRKTATGDTGRCCAGRIYAGGGPGAQYWGGGGIYDSKGTSLSIDRPAENFLIWWDGDLEREILDKTGSGESTAKIEKMGTDGKLSRLFTSSGNTTRNGTKGNPTLSADIFGDWREELILASTDNKFLNIYMTPIETNYRITTLMHDPHYRNQVAGQNICYNQPPHTSFYMGSDAGQPPRPAVSVNSANLKSNSETTTVTATTTTTAPATTTAPPITTTTSVTTPSATSTTVTAVTAAAAPINGTLIKSLNVFDTQRADRWSIEYNLSSGNAIFNDRDYTFVSIPDSLKGAEWIKPSCDSKTFYSTHGSFVAGEDITVYFGVDTRISSDALKANGFTDTGELAKISNDVGFHILKKEFAKGETVILPANTTAAADCVQYFVAAVLKQSATINTTVNAPRLYGDANDDGEVTIDDVVAVRLYCLKPDVYKLSDKGFQNALVIVGQSTVQGNCAVTIQDFVVEKLKMLPITG